MRQDAARLPAQLLPPKAWNCSTAPRFGSCLSLAPPAISVELETLSVLGQPQRQQRKLGGSLQTVSPPKPWRPWLRSFSD
jgi:hypothetical protein